MEKSIQRAHDFLDDYGKKYEAHLLNVSNFETNEEL